MADKLRLVPPTGDLEGAHDAQRRSPEPFTDVTNQLAQESLVDKRDSTVMSHGLPAPPSPRQQPTRAATLLGKLAPEMLAMIFERAAGIARDGFSPCPEALMRPFQCAAVCPRWRAVALGTKSLWTQIAVQSYMNPACTTHVRRFAKLALDRSGSQPLDVAVGWYTEDPADTQIWMDILGTLVQHCSRWRTLAVFGGDEESVVPRYFAAPLRFLGQPTPMLEEVYFDFVFLLDEDTLRPPAYGDCLLDAPNLRTARLADVPAVINPLHTHYDQATTLILDDSMYYLSRFVLTLCCFSNITTLRLSWRPVAVDVETPASDLVLPRLEALTFKDPVDLEDRRYYEMEFDRFMQHERLGMGPIFNMLVAPELRALTVQAEGFVQLKNITCRASDSLEVIDISGLQDATPLDAEIALLLANATQLRRLRLAHCDLTQEFLRELCAAAEHIWPHLRELELDSVLYDDELLLRFFKTRYPQHEAVCGALPPVVVIQFSGETVRDSPTALAISSLLDNERAQRSLPRIPRPSPDNSSPKPST